MHSPLSLKAKEKGDTVLYKKILVPLDGSKSSISALQEAIKIAQIMKGEITITHVYSIGTSIILSSKQEQLYKLALKKSREVLLNGKKLAKAEGFRVETLLLEGDTVEQIVKTAKEGDFNLIVMGARGLSKISEFVLGSVSHGVIKSVHCPVLVTK